MKLLVDMNLSRRWVKRLNEEGLGLAMKIKVVVHEAEEGGYWAEVPAIPGCATQGESMEELLRNVREAIEGCLSVDIAEPKPNEKLRILEIAV
jgi:predicted RNase H-like HicB family nuclease